MSVDTLANLPLQDAQVVHPSPSGKESTQHARLVHAHQVQRKAQWINLRKVLDAKLAETPFGVILSECNKYETPQILYLVGSRCFWSVSAFTFLVILLFFISAHAFAGFV